MEQQQKPSGNPRHRRHHGGKPQREQQYNPPYAKEVLDRPLSSLDLREGTLGALTAAKIATVRDLAIRRLTDMYKVQNFGKKNLGEVRAVLGKLGVDFRPGTEAQKENKEERAQNADPKQHNKGQSGGQNPQVSQKKGGQQGKPQQGKPQPQQGKGAQPVKGGQFSRDEGKNKKGGKDFQKDESLTLAQLYPRKKFVPSAPIPEVADRFVKFQRGGKWGFRDKSGKELIPPIYDEVFNFKDDYACVERKGLFGYINRDNELVIPYRYKVASSFSEGLACVGNEEKCGYIDKEGNVVCPFVYDAGTAVKDGLAKIKKDGRWGTLNLATKEISW